MARYYRILDLEPGASPAEVKQAYRDLAIVWHPDRFPNHPRLQQKAQAKFQAIQEAYEQLRNYQAHLSPNIPRPASASPPAPTAAPVHRPPEPPPPTSPSTSSATPLKTRISTRGWSCLGIVFLGYLVLGLVLSGPGVSDVLEGGIWLMALAISWPQYRHELVERLVALMILGWMTLPILVLILALVQWQSLPFTLGFVLLAGILVSGGMAPILIYELRHELPKYRSRLEVFLVLAGIAWLGLGLGFGCGPIIHPTAV